MRRSPSGPFESCCVTQWPTGVEDRAHIEDIILWDCWTDAFRKDFMSKWKNQVADSVHHMHRRDGGYIDQYGEYDEQHFSSMSAAHIIYPLFITLMPRRTEGTQPDSLYPTLEALADDEISHFVDKLGAFVRMSRDIIYQAT